MLKHSRDPNDIVSKEISISFETKSDGEKEVEADLKKTLKVGTVVRVLYPDYAAGIEGVIQAQEGSGRWIVQLQRYSGQDPDEPLLLSLEESDFEMIDVDN